jgi:hypothetical protein
VLGQQYSEVDSRVVLSVDFYQACHSCACRGDDLGGPSGWDLIQRDWGLRQREPGCARSGLAHRLVMRVEAALARIRLFVGRVLRQVGFTHACSTE